MMAKLTKQQLVFLQFLRDHSGKTVSVAATQEASGLNDASWAVYVSAGRYAPYLIDDPLGFFVAADDDLSEQDFQLQVTQSKAHLAPAARTEGYRRRYKLEKVPLGIGGFAEVFSATDRASGAVFALKRLKIGPEAEARIRREVDVLSQMSHPNVMPISDFDASQAWYCMPIASDVLVAHDKPKMPNHLSAVIGDVILGLEHLNAAKGHVHRDVAPGNILQLGDGAQRRWVLSDLGTVKRPKGETTELRTQIGALLGTGAFAAPELWSDAHDADWRADAYGVGRVVAWLHGIPLIPNVPAVPDGPWRKFVEHATRIDRDKRPSTHAELRALAP
jgi:hypothetical protein